MTSLAIRVPIAPGAPDFARNQTAEWARLFSSHALTQRMERFSAVGIRPSSLEGPAASPVRESMTWGTTVEVVLRLIDFGLPEQQLADVDALAVLMRISQGLVERRGRGHTEIASQLREATQSLLQTYAEWADVCDAWERAMTCYLAEDPIEWAPERIRSVGIAQPLYLSVWAASALSRSAPGWAKPLSADYAILQWVAKDVATLTLRRPVTRTVGPISDAVHLEVAQGSPGPIEAVAESPVLGAAIQVMDETAEHLHLLVEASGNRLPKDVLLYARTTLDFAGLVYSRLGAKGYV